MIAEFFVPLWLLLGYLGCMIGKRIPNGYGEGMPGVLILLLGPVGLFTAIFMWLITRDWGRGRKSNWWVL